MTGILLSLQETNSGLIIFVINFRTVLFSSDNMASNDTILTELDLIWAWSRTNHSATLDLPQQAKENDVRQMG
jgi:hypothetical protein